MTKPQVEDIKLRKFAVDRALRFYKNKQVGNPQAMADPVLLLSKNIYEFISNTPYGRFQTT